MHTCTAYLHAVHYIHTMYVLHVIMLNMYLRKSCTSTYLLFVLYLHSTKFSICTYYTAVHVLVHACNNYILLHRMSLGTVALFALTSLPFVVRKHMEEVRYTMLTHIKYRLSSCHKWNNMLPKFMYFNDTI